MISKPLGSFSRGEIKRDEEKGKGKKNRWTKKGEWEAKKVDFVVNILGRFSDCIGRLSRSMEQYTYTYTSANIGYRFTSCYLGKTPIKSVFFVVEPLRYG